MRQIKKKLIQFTCLLLNSSNSHVLSKAKVDFSCTYEFKFILAHQLPFSLLNLGIGS